MPSSIHEKGHLSRSPPRRRSPPHHRSPPNHGSPPHHRSPAHSSPTSSPRRGNEPKSFFNLYVEGGPSTNDPTRLLVAVKESDIITVKKIVRGCKSLVHTPDENGRTALHWSVVLGSQKCTKFILKNTGWWYLDRSDHNGCTALHYAAQSGRSDEVRRLLNRGAYVNARDRQGRTALHYAALTGNPFIVQKLCAHGASLWMKDKAGHMPLDLASTHELIEFLDKLMEPRFACLGICYPKKKKITLHEADRYPLKDEGNPIKRFLPINMLKTKLTADATRKKHQLVHRELGRRGPRPETKAEARKNEKALKALVSQMEKMEIEDEEREIERTQGVLRKLPADY